jgi:hypothetical protein
VIVTVLEEERHYESLKYTGFEHFPRSPVWHPADDVVKLFLSEDSVKLHGELLNTIDIELLGRLRGIMVTSSSLLH